MRAAAEKVCLEIYNDVITDDYGPWTASTLRLSSEILLPADEVAG